MLARAMLRAPARHDQPPITNREICVFNGLVYCVQALSAHLRDLEKQVEGLVVLQQPLDLRRVTFVPLQA